MPDTIQYTYDAYGKLRNQKNARGQTTTFVYDAAGRINSETCPEMSLTYHYVASGKAKGQLEFIKTANTELRKITYNDQGFPAQVIEKIDGTDYITKYTYDNYGRLQQKQSPSGFKLVHVYSADGYLTALRNGDNSANLWSTGAVNAFGQVTSGTLGNGLTRTTAYDNNNFLLDRITLKDGSTPIDDIDYSFTASSGNLGQRNDLTLARNEVFGYDALNRLNSVKLNTAAAKSIGYKPDGSINNKFDVGTYKYANNNHAVSGIENLATGYAPQAFDLEHTSFNRTSEIELDGQRMIFSYGPDRQRNVSRYYASAGATVPQTTRYYNGAYEKEVTGNTTKEYDYIYSPEGLAAIAVKTGGTRSLFYTHTDHLGSLRTVTGADKTIKAQYSYDAWGVRTPKSTNTMSFTRGFTGHEHLDDFGLINMNARMYDPALGRFLSVDPYVQMPDYTQSFNRYSYCLNNPLMYTDPDGEFWWLIAAAAAYTLFFTDVGYEVQKYISPVAIKFEVHPFGSHQRGFGANVSLGAPQLGPASYRWSWGATYYTKFYDTGWQGWETRYGEEYGLLGLYSTSFTDYTMHGMDDFNQTVLRLRWGAPALSANYYNDYIHHDKFKFFRKISPDRIITKGDDMQDRWRTAATHIQVGPFSWGMQVITGDAGPYREDGSGREVKYDENGYPYYVAHENYDPGKYSHGVTYVGIGPFRIGRDSEGDRNKWQNEFAHRPNNIPFFPKIPGRKPRWYWFW